MALWILSDFAAQYFFCTRLSLINIGLIKITGLSVLLTGYPSIRHLFELPTKIFVRIQKYIHLHLFAHLLCSLTKVFFDSLESKLLECISTLMLPSKSLLAVLSQSIVSCFIPNKSTVLNIDILIYKYKISIKSPMLQCSNIKLSCITYIMFLCKRLFKMFLYNFVTFVSCSAQTRRTSRNSFQRGKPILRDNDTNEPALFRIFPITEC